MTRDLIISDIAALEAASRDARYSNERAAIKRAIKRLESDLEKSIRDEAVSATKTKRVWIDIFPHDNDEERGRASDYDALVWDHEQSARASAVTGTSLALVVVDIPIRDVPVVKGEAQP